MGNPSEPRSDAAVSHLDFWLRMAGTLDAAGLARLMDNLMNLQVVIDHEFERRYPQAWEGWWKDHE